MKLYKGELLRPFADAIYWKVLPPFDPSLLEKFA